jgi:Flp pilus assembly protein TadG
VIRPFSRQRGQAVIEYAIAASVFLLLTVGVIDAGRAIWAYNTVAYLARDGARFGTIPSHSSIDIQNYVTSRCGTLLDGTCIVPAPTRGVCGIPSSPVIVIVKYPFHAVSPLIANLWGGGSLTLQAASQMYVEQAPAGGCAS